MPTLGAISITFSSYRQRGLRIDIGPCMVPRVGIGYSSARTADSLRTGSARSCVARTFIEGA